MIEKIDEYIELVKDKSSAEEIINVLYENGADVPITIKVIMNKLNLGLGEASELVFSSKHWSQSSEFNSKAKKHWFKK